MNADEPTEDELIRLLVTSWASLRAGTLDPSRQALLERERPEWLSEAANLVAEGLLAYVAVEMVEPDLDHDQQVDPTERVTAQEFAARVGAALLDFVDYRRDLDRVSRLTRH